MARQSYGLAWRGSARQGGGLLVVSELQALVLRDANSRVMRTNELDADKGEA